MLVSGSCYVPTVKEAKISLYGDVVAYPVKIIGSDTYKKENKPKDAASCLASHAVVFRGVVFTP